MPVYVDDLSLTGKVVSFLVNEWQSFKLVASARWLTIGVHDVYFASRRVRHVSAIFCFC